MPRRRRQRRNNNGYGRSNRVPRTTIREIVPDSVMVQLPYTDSYQRTPGTPTDVLAFRLNSLYDPDVTFTGHQPYGFDQWATFYQKYRVWKVDIECWVNSSGGGNQGVHIAEAPYLSSGNLASAFTAAAENSYARIHSTTQSTPQAHWKRSINLPGLLGQDIATFKGDDSNEALVGADPAQNVRYGIFLEDIISNVAYGIVYRLVFHAEFFVRAQLTPS